MKRKRGRPRGKVFPQPDSLFKGFWTADFCKMGSSVAMEIVMMCPHAEIRRIQSLPPDKLSKTDKQSLKLRRAVLKKWNFIMGQIVGEKIASDDSELRVT